MYEKLTAALSNQYKILFAVYGLQFREAIFASENLLKGSDKWEELKRYEGLNKQNGKMKKNGEN